MVESEFTKIALAIKTAYPNFKVLVDKQSMDIWFMMLSDLDYSILQPAILEHISTNNFPPSIADIRGKCATFTSIPIQDYGEAWESVLMAIRRFGYMQELEALESLSELTRKCVRRLGFRNICMSENITADRANFRMIYETEANRKKVDNQIPKNLLNQKQMMIDKLVENTCNRIEKKTEVIAEVKEIADMEQIDKLIDNFRRENQ